MNKTNKVIRSRIKLKIEFSPEDPPESIDDVLKQVFWRNSDLVEIARDFLSYIREWGMSGSPYRADEWEKYCTKAGISQGKYHNMLKRLRKAGMVKRVYNKGLKRHEIRISEEFSEYLIGMSRIWRDFCGA